MNKLEKLENITITYSKCLVLFLMCFIPFRNELELLLGTYIKVLPDMMILILLMGYVISQRGRVKIQLSDIIFCLFFFVFLKSFICNCFCVNKNFSKKYLFLILQHFDFFKKTKLKSRYIWVYALFLFYILIFV